MSEDRPTFLLTDALWRRRWLAGGLFLWALGVAAAVILSLPDVYRTSATVLVQRNDPPDNAVRPSDTVDLEGRIQTISHEMLSRTRLESLVHRFNLYPEMRRREPIEAAVNRLRADIKVDLKDASSDPSRPYTVAFTVSYVNPDPLLAALVTNNLAASYVEENHHMRNGQAQETAEVLRGQLDDAKRRLDEQDRAASAFRQHYSGALPEQTTANLAAIERLSTELRLNGDRQQRAIDRRASLLQDPLGRTSPSGAPAPNPSAARLAQLKDELVQLRAQYSGQYPDVRRVETEIARLESQMRAATGAEGFGGAPGAAQKPGVEAVDRELRALANEEANLKRQVADYQRRIEQTPEREQDLKQHTRDYATTAELYYSILKRYEDARLAENSEGRDVGEQFRVLDSALPPAAPSAPVRPVLFMLGCLLSLTVAGTAVLVAEHLDTSFHSLDELRAFTRLPVLATIPPIVTLCDVTRRRWRLSVAVVGFLCVLALTIVATHHVAVGNVQLVRLLARGKI